MMLRYTRVLGADQRAREEGANIVREAHATLRELCMRLSTGEPMNSTIYLS